MDFYENVLEECGITPLIEHKLGSIEPIMEWTKWLSYIPEFEKNKIDMLRTKKTTDLSLEECKFLIKFEEQTKMLRLFMKVVKVLLKNKRK